MDAKIRQATPEDAHSVNEVLRDSWLNMFENIRLGVSRESLEKEFEVTEDAVANTRAFFESLSDKRNAWVVEENGKSIGFCRATIQEDGTGKINAIYLLPEAQGKGVGKRLMQTALDWLKDCKEIIIECVYNNEKAIGFYKSFGFEVVKDASPNPHVLKTGEEIKVIRLKR